MIRLCLVVVLYWGPVELGTRHNELARQCESIPQREAAALIAGCNRHSAEECEILTDPRTRAISVERKIRVIQ